MPRTNAATPESGARTGPRGLPPNDREPDRDVLLRELHRKHQELDYYVRALSHDMTVNFILLENSFGRLRRLVADPSRTDVAESVAHVEACLSVSKRFLGDLVDLAKTGTVQMEPARVDVTAAVNEVLFEQHEMLASRGIAVEVLHPLPWVWCNALRFKQVVTNLVRNAARHGCDPKRPRITIAQGESSKPKEGGQQGANSSPFVTIRVHDNGPGIDPQFRDEIFLPGRRLSDAAPEGSGMGLAIVRKIVEHYGGNVRLASETMGGTEFVVCLPECTKNSGILAVGDENVGQRRVERDPPHQMTPPKSRASTAREKKIRRSSTGRRETPLT